MHRKSKLLEDKYPKNDTKFYGAVFWIAGINILIFTITQIYGNDLWYYLAERMSMIPVKVYKNGWIWTFITYMFLHGNIWHLIFNMIGILIFGYHVEKHIDSKEFLFFYINIGILTGIFSFIIYLISGNHWVALFGAGGTLYALILAYAVFYPDYIIYIYGIIPLRTSVLVILFIALELFNSIASRNAAHLTNLSGIGFAWLYIIVHFDINPWKNFRVGGKFFQK